MRTHVRAGTITAVPMDTNMLSIEEVGLGPQKQPPSLSPVCLQGFGLGVPLGFFYGHSSPQENPMLYKRLVTALAAQVSRHVGPW